MGARLEISSRCARTAHGRGFGAHGNHSNRTALRDAGHQPPNGALRASRWADRIPGQTSHGQGHRQKGVAERSARRVKGLHRRRRRWPQVAAVNPSTRTTISRNHAYHFAFTGNSATLLTYADFVRDGAARGERAEAERGAAPRGHARRRSAARDRGSGNREDARYHRTDPASIALESGTLRRKHPGTDVHKKSRR